MIVLSPEREEELVDALAEAFTPEDLDIKVADPLNVPKAQRSAARDVRERARALIAWGGTERTSELIEAALYGNPSSTRLRRFAESTGLVDASSGLVEVMRPALTAGQDEAWLRSMVEVQRQVCSVHIRTASGSSTEQTGFLVGDDLVMTLAVHYPDEPGTSFQFVFDSVTLGPNSNNFVVVTTGGVSVLRLERAIARELEQRTANVAVRARGWISPANGAPVDPEPSSPLVIVQHSRGSLRVTAEIHGFVRRDEKEIRYRTTTLHGSSGAPCFDEQWRLVGVHRGFADGTNVGLFVEAIGAALHERGYRWDASRGVHRAMNSGASPDPPVGGTLDDVVRGIASSLGDADVWSDDVEDLELDDSELWPWIEAAAVLVTFDPSKLVSVGNGSDRGRTGLLFESRQVGARWSLNETLRKLALKRLGARGALPAARAANAGDGGKLDATLGELIGGTSPTSEALRDPASLRALVTAIDWLDGAMLGLPDRDQLRSALERATLLAPFRHLTRGFFAGRDQELRYLAEYADGAPQKPLFLHAPGGMGKSALLARFILQNAERDPHDATTWRPFVYLDFDRPELDAVDLVGILLAIVKQLGPQIPSIAADAAQLMEDERKRQRDAPKAKRRPNRKRQQSLAAQLAPDQLEIVLDATKKLFDAVGPGAPIVVVLDTLEEVQFASPDAIGPLMELVKDLAARVSRLRPIFAGRVSPYDEEDDDDVDVDVDEAERAVTTKKLLGLPRDTSETLLQNELPEAVAKNTDIVTKLVEIVGAPDEHGEVRANPLSLKLAAEVVRREVDDAARVIEEMNDELRTLVGDALVQGRLYERILGHVHDKRIEAIAHPGLALRRFTKETIRDVLAGPCGLGVIGDVLAQDLFDALAKEIALVTQGRDDKELVLRPEIRRIVREDLGKDQKRTEQRTAIHRAAVVFYEKSSEPRDRAELIYHHLALDEDPDLVDRLWITGIENFLRDAVGDLSPRANAYLANRVGGVADQAQIETATPTDWEIAVGKRAGNLLRFGQPQKALDLLATRSERLPTSKLHYVESIARRMLPAPDLHGAETAAERAVTAGRTSSNADDLREALEELVRVRRLRDDTAGVLRALADLGNLADLLGDDLVLLQSDVEGLEALGPVRSEKLTSSAVRVFNRLPDELVMKAPELARRVAAQVGDTDASTLQRVIRLVGFGALSTSQAAWLAKLLAKWQAGDASIGAVPRADAPPREIASSARYLFGSRDLPQTVANGLVEWMRPIVVPKPSIR
ncbi:MAG: AAA family ATPase [Kofleriaceae bacterium]